MTIQTEVQKLSPSALVELFELDLRLWGGEILRFHAGVNALGRDVVWQGQPYVRLPIEAEGFERRGQGALPRPRIRVANIDGLLGAEARAFEDFVGCRLIRKRTFARFLDAVNFPEGNPEADPNQHFSDEIWCVDRKAAENAVYLEFELAASIDLPGVRLQAGRSFRRPALGFTAQPSAATQGTHILMRTTGPPLIRTKIGAASVCPAANAALGSMACLTLGAFQGRG